MSYMKVLQAARGRTTVSRVAISFLPEGYGEPGAFNIKVGMFGHMPIHPMAFPTIEDKVESQASHM